MVLKAELYCNNVSNNENSDDNDDGGDVDDDDNDDDDEAVGLGKTVLHPHPCKIILVFPSSRTVCMLLL